MPSTDEVADLLDRLVAAARRQRAAAAATRGEVNATDLNALDLVRRSSGIGPSRLARAMHMTDGGTNGVARRLIGAKLIARRVSPRHRNDVRYSVTESGGALVTTGVGGWDPAMLEQLEGHPAADNMMDMLLIITVATERRADRLADDAKPRRVSVQHPGRWG